jgi:hypothetical protein
VGRLGTDRAGAERPAPRSRQRALTPSSGFRRHGPADPGADPRRSRAARTLNAPLSLVAAFGWPAMQRCTWSAGELSFAVPNWPSDSRVPLRTMSISLARAAPGPLRGLLKFVQRISQVDDRWLSRNAENQKSRRCCSPHRSAWSVAGARVVSGHALGLIGSGALRSDRCRAAPQPGPGAQAIVAMYRAKVSGPLLPSRRGWRSAIRRSAGPELAVARGPPSAATTGAWGERGPGSARATARRRAVGFRLRRD